MFKKAIQYVCMSLCMFVYINGGGVVRAGGEITIIIVAFHTSVNFFFCMKSNDIQENNNHIT